MVDKNSDIEDPSLLKEESEDNLQKSYPIKKKQRRTRNDNIDRNFNCGCGKSYLSYPALYTHLKQKHDGNIPHGTQMPHANGKGRKGRPKNEEKNQIDDDNNSEVSEEQCDPLYEILYFLKTLGKNLKKDDLEGQPQSNADEAQRVLKAFPTDLFIDQKENYLAIYENLEHLLLIEDEQKLKIELDEESLPDQRQFQDDLEIDEDSKIKDTKLNKIFAQFIYYMSKFVQSDCLRECAFFCCLYRRALNEFGWGCLEEIQLEKGLQFDQDLKKMEFCEVNNGELALEVCNKFFTEGLPKYFKEYKLDNFSIIGNGGEESENTTLHFTKHFCNWLFLKGFTNSKLVFNTEDDY